MNNYAQIKHIIEQYIEKNGFDTDIESSIKETSYDKTNNSYLCDFGEDFKVIDMDVIAKDVYGKIYPSGKTRSTADAFFVLENGQWYFVEFKNSKIDNTKLKYKVQLKAYENLHMLFDILYEMKELLDELGCVENPIDFIRKNVIYILVCSEEKNIREAGYIRNSKRIKEQYVPGFLEELNSSIFKEAYVLTEEFFRREFVEN